MVPEPTSSPTDRTSADADTAETAADEAETSADAQTAVNDAQTATGGTETTTRETETTTRETETASGGTETTVADSGSVAGGTDDPVEARLADALERVAYGATVSVPSILLARGLTVAFTAVLTNGFAASSYGVFAVARRLQQFLLRLALGFGRGLSRFLPNVDSRAERDAIVTVGSVLLLGVATVLGAALFLGVPLVTRAASQGPQFRTILRVFAVGLPATVSLFAAVGVLRGLEEVGPLNLALRVGFPVAQLLVGVVGTVVFGDLVVVAAGVVGVMGLVAIAVTAWLVRERGVRPRFGYDARAGAEAGTDDDASAGDETGDAEDDGVADGRGTVQSVWRRYLRYTFPLFLGAFATTVQRLGFYPLVALYLTDVAGGVFAVGMLVGSLARLPLTGINQFISPVAAALHEEAHRDALARLYHVTSRLVLVGVTGLVVPVIVYHRAVMGVFGPTFVEYSPLLAGFVLAQYGACAAGSVGILLAMTDNQRALLVVNTVVTLVLVATAVPLTIRFGLPGLVASFVLMLTLNNGLEVAVLYHLEGLQPFTRLHLKPLLAAVPLAAVALAARAAVPAPYAPVAGVGLGLVAYGFALRSMGFTSVERRLAGTLAARYRTVAGRYRSRVART